MSKTREEWLQYAENLASEWEAQGVTTETHVWFACHHSRLAEPIVGTPRERLTYIATRKPLKELPARFASITVCPIAKLPALVRDAYAEWKHARAEWERAYAEWNRVRGEYDDELYAIYCRICPNNKWDRKMGRVKVTNE